MVSALIVAAGRGVRMAPDHDKLFITVAGRPIIAHTWRRFDAADSIGEIVLVIRPELEKKFIDLARAHNFHKPFQLVSGGQERQDSVLNGLEALSDQTEIVVIQDGARPFVTPALIQATIDAAREVGASVAARKVTDTIKESLNGEFISRNVDRSSLWAVETPQTFRLAIIRRALRAVREQGLRVTDDTAACDYIGQTVKLVENPSPNPKVTMPQDIPYIEWLLRNEGEKGWGEEVLSKSSQKAPLPSPLPASQGEGEDPQSCGGLAKGKAGL